MTNPFQFDEVDSRGSDQATRAAGHQTGPAAGQRAPRALPVGFRVMGVICIGVGLLEMLVAPLGVYVAVFGPTRLLSFQIQMALVSAVFGAGGLSTLLAGCWLLGSTRKAWERARAALWGSVIALFVFIAYETMATGIDVYRELSTSQTFRYIGKDLAPPPPRPDPVLARVVPVLVVLGPCLLWLIALGVTASRLGFRLRSR
jgi:hypothetical protein